MTNRKLLYDGVFEKNLSKNKFLVSGIEVSLSEILSNSLDKISDTDDYQNIIEYFKFNNINSEFLNYFPEHIAKSKYYKSQDNLPLFFIKKENNIYLFSFGEKQPGRYQLYYEGEYSL